MSKKLPSRNVLGVFIKKTGQKKKKRKEKERKKKQGRHSRSQLQEVSLIPFKKNHRK